MAVYVAVFALVLAYVALVAAYAALRTLAKLRRASTLLTRGGEGRSVLEATQRHVEQTAAVAAELESLREHVDAQHASALEALARRAGTEDGALRNVALVRYDAFSDMAGRMSFSLALLDDRGDGVTISAITGRSDTRVYAKAVNAGKGEQELSPEEQQAVTSATGAQRLKKAG